MKSLIKKRVGERIKRAREAAGMRQSQLADRLNVEPSSVQRWEAGRMMPGHDKAAELAKAFGKSIEYFAGVEGESPAPSEQRSPRVSAALSELKDALAESSQSDLQAENQRLRELIGPHEDILKKLHAAESQGIDMAETVRQLLADIQILDESESSGGSGA